MSGYGFTQAGTAYDDEDRLTGYARANSNLTQSWSLTSVGDWSSITTNGTSQTRTHGPTHELLTAGGQNVTTDVKGNITVLPSNLLTPASTLGLVYDFDNKMKSADVGNNISVDVEYKYDALGRRVARSGSSGSYAYVQADQQTLVDYGLGDAPSSPLYRYVYGSYIDEPVVRKGAGSGGTIYYYHRNQQYSITAITNSSAGVVERYAYQAYGEPTILDASGSVISSSSISNRYTYTGREWDGTLGLYHFRARWMSGLTGRFLTRDPIGFDGGSLNVQEYCQGKPFVYVDPSGNSCITCTFVRGGLGGTQTHVRNVDCMGLAENCCASVGPINASTWVSSWRRCDVPDPPPVVDLCAGDWENSGFANCWSCCVKKWFNPMIGLPAAGASGCCMYRIQKGQSLSHIETKSLGRCCGEWITNCRRAVYPNAPGNPWPMRICGNLGRGGGLIVVGGCAIGIEGLCAAYCGG
ncbi:MAG: RHS repeat-associated core domain-containing protein [Pirellula sp.]